MRKTECKRIGYEYKEMLNQICSFIEAFPPAKDLLSNYTIKKLQELCLKLATGEYELIEFGNEIKTYEDIQWKIKEVK